MRRQRFRTFAFQCEFRKRLRSYVLQHKPRKLFV